MTLFRRTSSPMAVLTLALGIGVTVTVFSLLDRVLLRAVPFPDPDRLVVVWETNPRLPIPVMVASPPTLHDWVTRNRSFDAIGAFRWRDLTLGGGEPEQVRGATVTAPLLRLLGVQPALGRLFLDEDDRAGAPPVVLLADSLWKRRFGADPQVLGRVVPLDGVGHEVVGVMPPGYAAPPPVVMQGPPPADRAELWVPLATDLAAGQRGAHNLFAVARLRPGVSVSAADADVQRIAAEVGRELPDYREWGARVLPLAAWVTQTSARAMVLLAAAVGVMFLLACANVANLLVARGVGRRREFAIRVALGAGRRHLAGQLVRESLALALAGGAAGLALAFGLVRLVVRMAPADMPGVADAAIDARALAVAGVLAVVAAGLAALPPAVQVLRARLREWLTERGAGAGPGVLRLQRGLVVGQVGLAVALMAAAALLVESFRQLRGVDPGFRPERVISGKVVLPAARYPDAAARAAFVGRLLDEVRGLPGVAAAGISDAVPMADNRQGTSFARLDRAAADEAPGSTNFTYVTDGYFDALGMRLLRGRAFTPDDALGGRRVLVVNQRLARQFFGDDDPVGREVRVGVSSGAPFEVVGVVEDDRHLGVDADPTPTFFLPYRQVPAMRQIAILARVDGGAASAASAVRAVVRRLDAEMALSQVRTMDEVVDASIDTPRSLAWLLSGFGASGLLLAAIGVFGVLSYAVGQRRREIGVRLALGASPGRMMAMILGEGLLQVAIGVLLGATLAAGAARLLSGLLFGVSASAPAPYAVVVALLALATLAACLPPARRAMRVDPAVTLRGE